MRYRIMRVLVFFDLPTLTSDDRRNYRQFRKTLINEGFLMLQYSVYMRVVVDKQSAKFMEERLAKIVPDKGIVQTLIVTEKQYQGMRFLVGQPLEDVRNTDDRLVII